MILTLIKEAGSRLQRGTQVGSIKVLTKTYNPGYFLIISKNKLFYFVIIWVVRIVT